MPEQRKLFLLDAYALIYRAYYALMRTPRVTSGGLNTSAIYGFCNTLDEVLRKENPGYMAVCFDPRGGRTFRHDKYEQYKAGRDKQPEDITVSIPYIKRLLEAMRIPVVEMEGYEADDLIGTLSHRAAQEGFVTYMMTPDKDYGQLVTDKVLMYRPSIKGQGFEVRGPAEVCGKYGISSPAQIIDLLALEGDASDNVPGCPGVGEKTAVKLIEEFGSVENLLANTQRLKGALKTRVEENAAQIRLSKWLVTIETSVPGLPDPEQFARREADAGALRALFEELEFKTFMTKFGLADVRSAAPVPQQSAAPVEANLFDIADAAEAACTRRAAAAPLHTPLLETAGDIAGFIDAAAARQRVGIGVLADGESAMMARPAGMALAYLQDNGTPVTAYFRFPDNCQLPSAVAQALQTLLRQSSVTIVSADIKRDMIILRRMGIEFDGAAYFDTAVAHYLCQPEARHDIEELARIYLGQELLMYGLPANKRDAAACAADADSAAIAGERAAAALMLLDPLTAEAGANEQLKLLNDIEMPFVQVLADMEWQGARVNPAELNVLADSLTGRLRQLESEAYAIAGHPFNTGSPSQVGQILFGELAIDPKARKTKGGSWSTAEDVLEKYASQVPLVRIILDIRALSKLLTTYVTALPRLINPRTGKLHTTFRQTVTATGRISSMNPNLQNIPVRSADGREIRRAFVADAGDLLLSADYSQIELRLMADLSGDSAMIHAFVQGMDIHRATAAKIYHVDLADVTDDMRRNAKTANFGIIYGISAFGLSERLGIPRTEAKALIEGYMQTYPGVAEYMRKSVELARDKGYVSTVMGRRRYLPDINSRSNTVRSYAERNAINAPLQGSAADIIKLAMVRIFNDIRRRGLKSRMILQVHDELIFNVKRDELAELRELVTKHMESAYSGRVPMEVASGIADNWLDAH